MNGYVIWQVKDVQIQFQPLQKSFSNRQLEFSINEIGSLHNRHQLSSVTGLDSVTTGLKFRVKWANRPCIGGCGHKVGPDIF